MGYTAIHQLMAILCEKIIEKPWMQELVAELDSPSMQALSLGRVRGRRDGRIYHKWLWGRAFGSLIPLMPYGYGSKLKNPKMGCFCTKKDWHLWLWWNLCVDVYLSISHVHWLNFFCPHHPRQDLSLRPIVSRQDRSQNSGLSLSPGGISEQEMPYLYGPSDRVATDPRSRSYLESAGKAREWFQAGPAAESLESQGSEKNEYPLVN